MDWIQTTKGYFPSLREKTVNLTPHIHLREGHWINNTAARLPARSHKSLNYLMMPNRNIRWICPSICKRPDKNSPWGDDTQESLLPTFFPSPFLLHFSSSFLCPSPYFFLVFFPSAYPTWHFYSLWGQKLHNVERNPWAFLGSNTSVKITERGYLSLGSVWMIKQSKNLSYRPICDPERIITRWYSTG